MIMEYWDIILQKLDDHEIQGDMNLPKLDDHELQEYLILPKLNDHEKQEDIWLSQIIMKSWESALCLPPSLF